MSNTKLKQMYSISQIMEMTGLGRTKVYEEIRSGFLNAKKIGSRTVVLAVDYEEWVNNLPNYLQESVQEGKNDE